jgi:hypothetical protein
MSSGPYVQVAVICETFIKGAQSGALSVINVLEGITVTGSDPDEMPPVTIGPPLKLVINLWAGQTRGRYSLKLRPEEPSGLQGDPITIGPLQFGDTGARGVDAILPMPSYDFTEEGLHWFDVLFGGKGQEDRLLTRIPFGVTYQPQDG